MRKSKQNISKKIVPTVLAALSIGLSFLLDKAVIQIVNIIQYPLLFNFFYSITLLGEIYVFIWIAIIMAIALIINRKPVLVFISSVATASIMEVIIKSITQRPRPFEALLTNSTVVTSLSSFPSGHTMIFFSIIPVMSKNFPKIKIILWTLAILIGLSRIYLGVHYFSDVVAGAIFGYAIGWTFMKLGEKYEWKN